MKTLFYTAAEKLGKRPRIVALILILLSLWLCWRLYKFVKKTDGFHYLDEWTAEQAAYAMLFLILLVWVALIFRLVTVNHTLRKKIFEKFREALRLGDVQAKSKIRQLVENLGIRGNLFSRFIRLIELAPAPFLGLVLMAVIAHFLLWLSYFLFNLYHPDGTWQEAVFANTPWVVASFLCIYLVFNDIWIIDLLEGMLAGVTVQELPDVQLHIEKFQEKLTNTELKIFQQRMVSDKSQKETASEMHVEKSTVKTHINNINKKWKDYQAGHQITYDLKDVLRFIKRKNRN